MTLTPKYAAIHRRALDAQCGPIHPTNVARIATLSWATRIHWAHSRADVLELVAEIRRLNATLELERAFADGYAREATSAIAALVDRAIEKENQQ